MYYEFIMQLLGSESPLTSFLPSFSPRLGCRNAQTAIAGTLRQATAKVNSKSIPLTALCSYKYEKYVFFDLWCGVVEWP